MKKPLYSRRRLKKLGITLHDRIVYLEVQIPYDLILSPKRSFRIINSIQTKKMISVVMKGFSGSVSTWNYLKKNKTENE